MDRKESDYIDFRFLGKEGSMVMGQARVDSNYR